MRKPILLIEDEEHDVIFMQLAMQEAEVQNPLIILRDGREALDFVNGEEPYNNRSVYPLPGLILLDLKLPFASGFEVLKCIRKHPRLAQTPVLMLSCSNQELDVGTAYSLGANAFVVKPGYLQLLAVVSRIKQYWLEMESPPPDCSDWLSVTIPRPNAAAKERVLSF